MKTDIRLDSCTVTDNREVAPGHWRLVLSAPGIARAAVPGQFVHVHMPREQRHMLPRPLSLYGADPERGEIILLFRVAGRGTALLAEAGPGSEIQVMGPLGTGFPGIPAGSVMVAGGMGVAPLAFLAASTAVPRTLIYGARSCTDLVCPASDLDQPGLDVVGVTEDGSSGLKGTAVDILKSRLPAPAVFACGPRGMLAAVASLTRQAGVEAWVSLEERMACGVGACLGCAVNTTSGYQRVCREGPVFPAREVVFDG